ncbi:MAG: 16S rRNA (cytosine(1402)-N(4))-methyltransferase RsmH [Fermentimonas sp.]|jgi:16S rRNA (cytosine1402-N4)-methyltransferase
MYHVPVLLKESVDGLKINPDGVYVDVTYGGGGHSREILSRLSNKGRLFAFDQDKDVEKNVESDERLIFVRSNFSYLKRFLRYYGVSKIDGLLADLGVSSHHFDSKDRGFSFRVDADLDMRMNRSSDRTASDVVNNYSEEELSNMFFLYGELKSSRRIASSIVEYRKDKPIEKTGELVDILEPFTRKDKENKVLAQAFQALRIEVNDEMKTLEEMLKQGYEILAPGGRMSVISYHSLEDRLVKNFFRSGNFEGEIKKDFFGVPDVPFTLINRKVITPSEEELNTNSRSRSAKLRIVEKI